MSDQRSVGVEPPPLEQHTPSAPAGWYQDPEVPGDAGRRRWWDGAAWGDHMVWSGVAWVDVDAPPQAPARRRRWWPWLVVGAVVLLGGVGALVVVGIGLNAGLTHELVATDFSSSPDPFLVGSDPKVGAYRFELVDGVYRIRATGPNEGSVSSVGAYARTAYTVDTSVEVRNVSGPGVSVAVGCLGPGAQGYVLRLGPDGAELLRSTSDDVRSLDAARVTVPPAPFRLGLECYQASPVGNRMTVKGLVDGRVVVEATEGDGVSGLDTVLLGMTPDADDASVTFGDVTATVPGA